MTSAQLNHRKYVMLPILMTCIGYACYNLNDVGLKYLLKVNNLHYSEVMLASSVIGIIFMTAYGWFREGKKSFRTNKPGLLFVRAALSQVTAFANLLAFPHMQLTTFYTLVFTSPFMVALIAIFFFKDKADRKRMAVIWFGFIVILCVFHPGGALLDKWALLILFSSFCYSWQMLVMRKIGSGEGRGFMYIVGYVMNFMIALPLLGDHYVPMTLMQWAIITGVICINGVGLLCISYAYQEAASPSVIAPYHYTQIIWGSLLGYFVFSEIPHPEVIVGAGLLIAAGIYLVLHESRKAAVKPPEAP